MNALRALLSLRQPIAALALCALLSQQLVGMVLTASPAMALEAGFSLCLSGPPPVDDDPLSVVDGAGFCPCTLHSMAGVLAPSPSPALPVFLAIHAQEPLAQTKWIGNPSTGPPPSRAPPFHLHS
ncbi:MAG: hypothetical protein AB8B88_13530 [Devosiaceae bacterium]